MVHQLFITWRDNQICFIEQGENAEVGVVINNGTIVEVNVSRPGHKYGLHRNLSLRMRVKVSAQLTPIITNTGFLEKVIVVNGGVGYSKKTRIRVENPGINANLYANIQNWDVNLFNKFFDSIGPDDGLLATNISEESLQYVNIVAPRKLRQLLNPIESSDNGVGSEKIFSKVDLEVFSGLSHKLRSLSNHWLEAYDGNPIYGPYGFSNRDGSGLIRQMKSGYLPCKIQITDLHILFFPQVTFLVIISLKILVILTSTMVVFVSHQISLVVFMLILPLMVKRLTLMDLIGFRRPAFPLFDR